jgi:HSP20 family protein
MNSSATENSDSPATHRLLAPLALIPACQAGNGEADWFPAVDILEDADEYLFRVDLPELDPEAIQVTVEGGGLLVSGQRPEPGTDAKRFLRIERPHGYFERRFELPEDASRHDIDSTLERGVLELHVRKVRVAAEEPAPVPVNTPPRLKLRRTRVPEVATGKAA